MNENNVDTEDMEAIKQFLPHRISKMGRAPSFGSYKVENKYRWPQNIEYLSPKITAKLMGIAMEQAVNFSSPILHTHLVASYFKMGGPDRGPNNNGCCPSCYAGVARPV